MGIATISAGDKAVGKITADAVDKVIADGVITIEDSKKENCFWMHARKSMWIRLQDCNSQLIRTFKKDEYMVSVCGERISQNLQTIELSEHDIENMAINSVNGMRE